MNGTFIGKTDDIIVPTVIKRRSSNIEVVTKKDLRESVLIKVLKEELLAIDNVNVIDLGAKKVDITYESWLRTYTSKRVVVRNNYFCFEGNDVIVTEDLNKGNWNIKEVLNKGKGAVFGKGSRNLLCLITSINKANGIRLKENIVAVDNIDKERLTNTRVRVTVVGIKQGETIVFFIDKVKNVKTSILTKRKD